MGSTSSTLFPTERHLYYALARALNRGYTPPEDSSLSLGPQRPALPVELVLEIFDLTEILQPTPSKSLTVYWSGECNITSHGSREEKLLFHSDALSRTFLARVRKMRLHTVSRDQGWVSDRGHGSWSWFEIKILQPVDDGEVGDASEIIELDFSRPRSPQDEHGAINDGRHDAGPSWESQIDNGFTSLDGTTIRRDDLSRRREDAEDIIEDDRAVLKSGMVRSGSSETLPNPIAPSDDANKEAPIKLRYREKASPNDANQPLLWGSHYNVLGRSKYTPIDGIVFTPDHDIWKYVDEGDVISVYACARYPAWQNNARSGKLEFWEKFDPMGLEGCSRQENDTKKY